MVLLLAAYAVGAATLVTLPSRARRPLLALALAVGGTTVALYAKYKFGDDYGYGAYKALVSGGALLAGLLTVTLAGESAGLLPWRAAAAGVCLAVWLPVTAGILQTQRNGSQGFREADRALIGELERLPRDDVVLVEGAAEGPTAFRLRMTAGYFAGAFDDRKIDGLGSTGTYMAPGGGALEWRPRRPWRYVVASDPPSAFSASRRTLWEQPPLRLQDAPVLDVTPYVTAAGRYWQTPPAGSPPSDLMAGPVEVVVGNRGGQDASAQLELEVRPLQRGRTVTVSTDGGARRIVRTTGRYPVAVPAGGTARVALDPGPPQPGPDGRPQPLVALTRIAVR